MLENEMKVTLPGIFVQRKGGTVTHYRNSEYIPSFYAAQTSKKIRAVWKSKGEKR